MDMFMDKLAQKLTAQEIIKANTAADVEELNKLKNQIGEYNECLTKLQRLIDDGSAKLSDMNKNETDVVRLVGEGMEGTKALRQDLESLKTLLGQLQGRLEGMDQSVTGEVESLSASVEVLSTAVTCEREALSSSMEALSASVGEKIDQLCGQLEAQSAGGVSERLDAVEENVHKECVKVYRNVQAVMMEESGKQNEALSETKEQASCAEKKAGAAKGFAIAAMVFSALSFGGVLYQILVMLGILSL